MKAGVVEISLEVLRDVLKLPKEVKLVKVRQDWEQFDRRVFEVLVESESLQDVIPGNKYPWLRCTLHAEFCRADEITHIVRTEIENYQP